MRQLPSPTDESRQHLDILGCREPPKAQGASQGPESSLGGNLARPGHSDSDDWDHFCSCWADSGLTRSAVWAGVMALSHWCVTHPPDLVCKCSWVSGTVVTPCGQVGSSQQSIP